jgi:hypothetical protein
MTRAVLKLVLAIVLATPGCTGSVAISGTTPVVYQEPPQDQVEKVIERPGFLWAAGRWNWQNDQWQWIGGHWERERAGFSWQPGHWERRGHAWHWIEGRWAPGAVVDPGTPAEPVVRDHREPTGEP